MGHKIQENVFILLKAESMVFRILNILDVSFNYLVFVVYTTLFNLCFSTHIYCILIFISLNSFDFFKKLLTLEVFFYKKTNQMPKNLHVLRDKEILKV